MHKPDPGPRLQTSTPAERQAYARRIVNAAGSSEPRLIDAFAQVPREDYLGPAPWQVFAGDRRRTLVADACLLYQDALVSLAPDRGINNGQPSLHAGCLAAAAPAPGETVVHVGAGTGYYTAILATLVGPTGRVIAFEIEADLAARAAAYLAHLPQVSVRPASATETPLPNCDVLYVNAGATHPPAVWLDALNVGGRLVFPLTPDEGFGVMLRVTRLTAKGYAAHAIARVAFVACIGARDAAASAALAAALQRQSMHDIRSLRRGTSPDATAWCVGDGWWLSTQEGPG